MTTRRRTTRRRSTGPHDVCLDAGVSGLTCYLGLDLSLTCSGVVAIDPDGAIIKQVPIMGGKRRGAERLHHLRECMTTFLTALSSHGYTDVRICIENYAMGIRGGKSFSIGEWGGVCRLLLFDRGLTYTEISPTALKKFITGKGSSGKDVILLETFKRWGESFTSNDLCDAYGLAQMTRYHHEGVEEMTKPQREALVKAFG